jgi:hypothetical protein
VYPKGGRRPGHMALHSHYGSRHSHHLRASSRTEIIFPQRLIISCRPLLLRLCEKSGQVVQGMKGQPFGVHQLACNSVNATSGSSSLSTHKYQPLSGGMILSTTVCWDLRVRAAGGGGWRRLTNYTLHNELSSSLPAEVYTCTYCAENMCLFLELRPNRHVCFPFTHHVSADIQSKYF